MDEKQRRNNTIFLTILAIIVLLIAIAGAAYAFLANSIDSTNNTTMNINTYDVGEYFIIDASVPISIHADNSNFGKGQGNVVGYAYPTVLYKSDKEHGSAEVYDIELSVEENNFNYTFGVCSKNNYTYEKECTKQGGIWTVDNTKAELLFNLYETFDLKENECLSNSYTYGKINDANVCYKLLSSTDVTGEVANAKVLLATKTISTTGPVETTQKFIGELIYINYDHIQIKNDDATFVGKFMFTRRGE